MASAGIENRTEKGSSPGENKRKKLLLLIFMVTLQKECKKLIKSAFFSAVVPAKQ